MPPKRSAAEVLLDNAPWKPPPWDLADANAIRALEKGTANPDQQKRALRYITSILCGLDDWPYRPGESDRDTNIALGRQFVGHMILKFLRIDLSKVRRDTK